MDKQEKIEAIAQARADDMELDALIEFFKEAQVKSLEEKTDAEIDEILFKLD